jgi:glutaminyl-peptide cyclotransferase
VHRDSFTVNGICMTNLRAVKGEGNANRPLLLSCHIDTKTNIAPDFESADDGASGAAVLLELARTLPQESAQQVELIFLDGEEAFARHMSETDGLYGSKFDVARRGSQLPRWQINLDMVGGRNKTIAVPSLDTSDFMYAQYQEAVRRLGFSEEKWTVWPGAYLDDHLPYLEAGVDSLNLIAVFSGSNWWHTPRDNMSRICPRSLHESGQMTLQLVQQLLSADGAGAQ